MIEIRTWNVIFLASLSALEMSALAELCLFITISSRSSRVNCPKWLSVAEDFSMGSYERDPPNVSFQKGLTQQRTDEINVLSGYNGITSMKLFHHP